MKQKQTQNIKIVIGEVKKKAKRRAAPRGPRAPRARAPAPAQAGIPQPPPLGPGAPGNFPIPQMFAARAGPAVESVSQLQQLVRPLEQSLLRLEQRAQPALPAPPAPQRDEGKEEAVPRLGMRDVADYVSRFYESFQQPYGGGRAALPSGSSSSLEYERVFTEIREMGTQSDLSLPLDRQVGIQYQIEEPEQALVEAVKPPLIDAVVRPAEREPEEPEEQEEMIIEEDEPQQGSQLTEEDLRRIRDRGGITEIFLQTFPVRGNSRKRGHNLLSIAKAIGVPLPIPRIISREASKDDFIRFILENLP